MLDQRCKFMGCARCQLLRPFTYHRCQSGQLNPLDPTIHAAAKFDVDPFFNKREVRKMFDPSANKTGPVKDELQRQNMLEGMRRKAYRDKHKSGDYGRA